MNLAHSLERIALADPQRPAVFEGDRLLFTYGELASRAARLAQSLRSRGLAPGDRVVLFLRNHHAHVELLYGAWWAGLVVVSVNAKLHAREAQRIIGHAEARVTFVTDDTGSKLAAEAYCIDVDGPEYEELFSGEPRPIEARRPEDLAWLFYTSGTTGRPKGVMLSHRNLMTMALAYFADVDAVEADAILHAAPMSHGAGRCTWSRTWSRVCATSRRPRAV